MVFYIHSKQIQIVINENIVYDCKIKRMINKKIINKRKILIEKKIIYMKI